MAIPSKVAGGGNNSTARNVFRVTFSQSLAAVPTLEGWDDATFSTTANQIFVGTAVNGNKPMLAGVETTDQTPASAWKPTNPVAGGALANRLLGTTNFVNLTSGSIPTAGQNVFWNLNLELPSDATVPSTTTLAHVIAVRFQFTGTQPTLTWVYNDAGAGGTEGAPVFTTITSGSAGNFIRYADVGSSGSNVVVTRPSSGFIDAGEVWVTAS